MSSLDLFIEQTLDEFLKDCYNCDEPKRETGTDVEILLEYEH